MATSTYAQTDDAQSPTLAAYCSTVGGTPEQGRQATIGGTTGVTATASISCGAGQTDDLEISYECLLPTDAVSSAEDATITIDISLNSMNVDWDSCFICRVNSSDVNQETIGSATGLGITTNGNGGILSTTISCSAVTFAAGDYVIIALGFSETAGHSAVNIQMTPNQVFLLPFNAPVGGNAPLFYDHLRMMQGNS